MSPSNLFFAKVNIFEDLSKQKLRALSNGRFKARFSEARKFSSDWLGERRSFVINKRVLPIVLGRR